MRKILIILVWVVANACVFGQTAPQKIKLFGHVLDSAGRPMIHAHIINISANIGTLTNYDGEFMMHVLPEDTLKFSSIGYKTSLMIIPYTDNKLYKKIYLDKDTVSLAETIIYPYPASLEALRKEFLTVEIEEKEPQIDLHLELANIEPEPRSEGGVIISGPISFLYETFSRHAKIQRKYYDLVNKDVIKKEASKKYSVAMVKKITGLESDEEVVKFMEFCDLEPEFILNTTEYEMILAISHCYVQYTESQIK
jgi:hypothetical protein